MGNYITNVAAALSGCIDPDQAGVIAGTINWSNSEFSWQ
jgi:hypothetical protein